MILTLDSIKRKTGKVSVRNGIVDKSLMIFQPPYKTRYGLCTPQSTTGMEAEGKKNKKHLFDPLHSGGSSLSLKC